MKENSGRVHWFEGHGKGDDITTKRRPTYTLQSAISEGKVMEALIAVNDEVMPDVPFRENFIPLRPKHIEFAAVLQVFLIYMLLPFTWRFKGQEMQYFLFEIETYSSKSRLSGRCHGTGIGHFVKKIGSKFDPVFPFAIWSSLLIWWTCENQIPLCLIVIAPALLLCDALVATSGLLWKDNEKRTCRLRRIHSLKGELIFDDLPASDWQKPTNSGLLPSYVLAMRKGRVSPILLLKQLSYGMTLEGRFAWRTNPVARCFELSQNLDIYIIFVLDLVFKVVLIALPCLTIDKLEPCFGTIFCYLIYALSIVVPGTGLSLMLNCSQIIRDELNHQTECLRMLGSMLSVPRKWEWLPKVRHDEYSDMLAWAEIYEYLEETPRSSFPFVLGVVGASCLFLYGASLVVTVFVLTLNGANKQNLPVIALTMWIFPFVLVYFVVVSIIGMRVNSQRKRLMQQLGLLVMDQQKFYGHTHLSLESSNVGDEDVPHLDERGLQSFKRVIDFTSSSVYRWEAVSYASSLMGIKLDMRNITAILTGCVSMMGYVVKNLSPGLREDICSLFGMFHV